MGRPNRTEAWSFPPVWHSKGLTRLSDWSKVIWKMVCWPMFQLALLPNRLSRTEGVNFLARKLQGTSM